MSGLERVQVYRADLTVIRKGLQEARDRAAQGLQAAAAAPVDQTAQRELRLALATLDACLGALQATAMAMGGGGE